MKKFICKKDCYIADIKFASVGDCVELLYNDNTVLNHTTGRIATKIADIIVNSGFFIPESEAKKSKEVCEDNVNNPLHYKRYDSGIECIDAMIAAYGRRAVMSFCKCNAFKYQWRFDKKNGEEDLRKAQWYQNKYLELDNGNKNKGKQQG